LWGDRENERGVRSILIRKSRQGGKKKESLAREIKKKKKRKVAKSLDHFQDGGRREEKRS